MTTSGAVLRRLRIASAICAVATLVAYTPVAAQLSTWTASDGYNAMNAYKSAFYFDYYAKAGGPLSDGYGFLKHEGSYDSSSNPQTGFWNWAEQIELTEDAYDNAERNGNSS